MTNRDERDKRSNVLYYMPGACSLAVHVVLEELGIPFRAHRLDMTKGEHRSREYLKINPDGRVPTLRFNNQIYRETPRLARPPRFMEIRI